MTGTYVPTSDGTFFDLSLDRIVSRTLNDIMCFDAPSIQVRADGTLTEQWVSNTPDALYGDTDEALALEAGAAGWDLLTGYSNQQGYNGPVLHTSEVIGGGLARDILATPGIYAVASVDDVEDDGYPIGWVVLRKR
jgi:hypothetical protein